MENILSRYRNLTILVAVLFLQVLALAVQVQRPADGGSISLLRSWVIAVITPVQKSVVHTQDWAGGLWRNYFYLRNVRSENLELRAQVHQLRIENLQLSESVSEAHRLQAILDFKERFIAQTVAARVIGSSGSETSRVLYIDKGSSHGLDTDMAVITPEGVVGKTVRVFPSTAQVLVINDQTSGLGAILEDSRLQGIVRGMHGGHLVLRYILNDEKVEVGERVVASGGERIFPKGFPIGTVVSATPGSDMFLEVRLRPAAALSRLEEVLVITHIGETQPGAVAERPLRAADVLAERLPSVPKREPPKPAAPAPRATPPPEVATPAPASPPEVTAPAEAARTVAQPTAQPAAPSETAPNAATPQDLPR